MTVERSGIDVGAAARDASPKVTEMNEQGKALFCESTRDETARGAVDGDDGN